MDPALREEVEQYLGLEFQSLCHEILRLVRFRQVEDLDWTLFRPSTFSSKDFGMDGYIEGSIEGEKRNWLISCKTTKSTELRNVLRAIKNKSIIEDYEKNSVQGNDRKIVNGLFLLFNKPLPDRKQEDDRTRLRGQRGCRDQGFARALHRYSAGQG